MPPRRNKEKFQQLTEFERGGIIDLREGGFSYRAIGARVQRNSTTEMRVWKQWTDEHQTTRKTGSGRRKVTSARDDQHLFRMAMNDRTASSGQLAARWSTATGSPSRQTIDGCVCNWLMNTEPDRLICSKLSFQINRALICGTMMAAFVLDAMPENETWRRRSNLDIYQSYKESGVANFIKIQRIKWAGHVIRMNEDRTTKKDFNSQANSTRIKGKPNLRWIDGLEKNFLVFRTKNSGEH
ncbi:uncharacterized protein TNCV_1232901 [Trichonephila clavipes]|nr:uncharacterized protein TNCV_1232901 [Trichonephila clavipes]